MSFGATRGSRTSSSGGSAPLCLVPLQEHRPSLRLRCTVPRDLAGGVATGRRRQSGRSWGSSSSPSSSRRPSRWLPARRHPTQRRLVLSRHRTPPVSDRTPRARRLRRLPAGRPDPCRAAIPLAHGRRAWALTVVGLLAAASRRGGVSAGTTPRPGRAGALAVSRARVVPWLPRVRADIHDRLPAMAAEFVCLGLGIVAVSSGRIRGAGSWLRWSSGSLASRSASSLWRPLRASSWRPSSSSRADGLPWLPVLRCSFLCGDLLPGGRTFPARSGSARHPMSDYFCRSGRARRVQPRLRTASRGRPGSGLLVADMEADRLGVGAIIGLFLVRERIGDLVPARPCRPSCSTTSRRNGDRRSDT